MSSDSVAGLQFFLQELLTEIDVIERIARKFIAPADACVLMELRRSLEQIGEVDTDIPQDLCLRPLRTIPTVDYEPGSRSGGMKLYAQMSGKWQLRPVRRVKSGPKRKVQFVGIASTVVELWEDGCRHHEENGNPHRVASWRIELGAYDSPGCYFHIQVLGDRDEPPFPKSVSIPRFPGPFVTPMAAVEFVIGEMFQDKWQQEASRASDSQNRWRSIQQKRWSNLLRWHKDALEGMSSPWMNLKEAKPPTDLFVS